MKIFSFKKWLEMVGTGAIYDPKARGDFNWWGSPEIYHKKTNKKRRRKRRKK